MAGDGRASQLKSLQRAPVDLVAWQIGVLLGVAGAVALYFSAKLEGPHGPSALDSLLRDVGALAFVTGTLSVVWDLRGKRQLTEEVLRAAQLSKAVQQAGLVNISAHYRNMDWDRLIKCSSQIDLFFGYASTWRANHVDALQAFVDGDQTKLRVILPDKNDKVLVVELAKRFATDPDDVVRKVRDAEKTFEDLHARSKPHKRSVRDRLRLRPTPARVELRVTRASPVFTYYRFDGRCIGVLYSQAKGRTPVPAFECERGGALHSFFSEQFEALWRESSARALG